MATHSSSLAWRIPWLRETLWATVHGVAKSQIRLSDYHFHFLWSSIHFEMNFEIQSSGSTYQWLFFFKKCFIFSWEITTILWWFPPYVNMNLNRSPLYGYHSLLIHSPVNGCSQYLTVTNKIAMSNCGWVSMCLYNFISPFGNFLGG